MEGAWERAMEGIESCKRFGLHFQIQTTVTTSNYHEIPAIIELSHKLGARVFISSSWSAQAGDRT